MFSSSKNFSYRLRVRLKYRKKNDGIKLK